MRKPLHERVSVEKDNYYLQQRDISNIGNNKITVADGDSLYHVDIVDGEVKSVSTPDGENKFDLDSINSQLKSGATLGDALTGEKVETNKLQEVVKRRVRKYLFS